MVRFLCLDIGHGLRSLHENHFTHGDLKPENVLIFNTGGTWTAKLCDFGCAVGQDEDTAQQDDATVPNIQKEEYLGTPYWLPSDCELAALGGFESLQQCDLYVYGLLVWSSFCLRGKHPPARPKLDDALTDLEELGGGMTNMLSSVTPRKQRLLDQVFELLKKTMVDPAHRSLEPWTYLYLNSGQCAQDAESDSLHDIETTLPEYRAVYTGPSSLHMTSKMKAMYNQCRWWHDDRGSDTLPDNSEYGPAGLQPTTDTDQGVLPDDDQRGPASRVALGLDDNCLSTTLFFTSKRFKDAEDLPRRMMRLVQGDQRHIGAQYNYQELYYLARFRSRVKLTWWKTPITACNGNILRQALRMSPPVDINTLAWLCAGSIGGAEVRALDGENSTWESILLKGRLDESSRLDRFLLLLQFGALVAKKASTRGKTWYRAIGGTVFVRYLRSCRPATIPTIMREIFRRLDTAWKEGLVSEFTFEYLVGSRVRNDTPFPVIETAKEDLAKDHNYTAMKALAQCIAQMRGLPSPGPSPPVTERRPRLPNERLFAAATETNPLFPRRRIATLPQGWKRHAGTGLECFEDDFTRSVTLTEPRVSPIRMRQIKVGFLQGSPSDWCHVDLLPCMRVGTSEDERRQFEQDLQSRFPYYDSSWFSTEWSKEPNTNDVLGAIKDARRIQRFTMLLLTPGQMDTVLAPLRVVLVGGILALAVAAIFVAIAYALWLTLR